MVFLIATFLLALIIVSFCFGMLRYSLRSFLVALTLLAAILVWIQRDIRYILQGRSSLADFDWGPLAAVAAVSVVVALIMLCHRISVRKYDITIKLKKPCGR